MAIINLRETNDKENIFIPNCSSPNPIAIALASKKQKRKLRVPLQDITNLLYPECVNSSPVKAPSVIDNSSTLLLAHLVRDVKNRYRRAETASFKGSSSSLLRKHFR